MTHAVAFLTTDTLDDFVTYDQMAVPPLAERGCTVDFVSWRQTDVHWRDYHAVVIRSPWDYQADCDAFLAVLETIETQSVPLLNPLAVVRWNIRKTYLQELADAGVPVVPTHWGRHADLVPLESLQRFGGDELVAKPVVGASAQDTFRLHRQDLEQHWASLAECYGERELMLQPFMDNIREEGEYSLFYFGGEYSHCIVKRPRPGDFRVQEEYGGLLQSITPTAALLQAADQVLSGLSWDLLYARIDFVRGADGVLQLMELELIEPSLYFPFDPDSPGRFADALLRTLRSGA